MNMPQDISKQWYATWFDSPYYHLLYKERDHKEAELFIDNLIDFLNPVAQSTFLDLACGKGRHSIYLHTKGFDVTGVDLSEQSIKYASKQVKEGLNFYVHDMRYPCRINYFGYVLNLFTSFGYFENEKDNYAVAASISKELRPKGIVVIDFLNAHKVISNLKKHETKEVDGIRFDIYRAIEQGVIIKQIKFSDKNQHYSFEERVTALELHHFEKYLHANKLKILNLFGDYSLNKFDELTSDRLIIIAQKE
jgi:SAM-dependent methyltransferase